MHPRLPHARQFLLNGFRHEKKISRMEVWELSPLNSG
jgi:hypothetical protein